MKLEEIIIRLGEEVYRQGPVKNWITYCPFDRENPNLGYLYINFRGELTWSERAEFTIEERQITE
jgi:hypothetical protein